MCGLALLAVVINTLQPSGGARAPVSLSATTAIQNLQARLFVAQEHEHAYEKLKRAVARDEGKYAKAKREHDMERKDLAKQVNVGCACRGSYVRVCVPPASSTDALPV